LYIQHPNGYSTVYAHLQKYAGAIQQYVKEKQYEKESYEIELFPESEVLPVRKGDLIGYTGNSGSSGGPHLHFEIRDSASRPMNPLLFGIDVPDTQPPLVSTVFAYPVGPDGQVNQSQHPVKLNLKRQKDGSFRTEKIQALGTVGFGVGTVDRQDGASNKNGVYKIRSTYNGSQKFEISFDRFSFSETRYLNRFIDYGHYKKNKNRVQKLFRESNNPLSIITDEDNSGYVTIEDGFTSVYTIEIVDFKDNKVTITIPIEGKNKEVLNPLKVDERMDFVAHDKGNSITKGKYSVYIPAESLYEDTHILVESSGDTLRLHEDVIPLHKNMTINFDASHYKKEDMGKLYIGRARFKGAPSYSSTYRNGSKLSTRTRNFGTFVIAMDSVAPVISPVNFKEEQWISNNETLVLKIEDEISGIGSYRATLNGKFILTEYDYKKDVLVYSFEDQIVDETENKLKVIVVDNVGNSATFEATFFRKQS
ncbi:MAG: M23 family metallopeptidase, partial [Bacteroidota bacterium]